MPPNDGATPFRLTSGRVAYIRPVRPDDRARFVAAFELLSEQSRYLRFFSCKNALTDAELDYFTCVDGVTHVAYGAVDEHGRGLAVGRYVVLAEEPDVAEVAVTVLDEIQGQGLGHALIERLVQDARQAGLRALRFWVHSTNSAMVHLLRGLGARLSGRDGPAQSYDLDVAGVDSDQGAPSGSR